MSTIRLMFSTTRWPLSAAIRAATWSRWSHVALVEADAVIEAVAIHGVRRAALPEAIAQSASYCFVDMPARSPASVMHAANAEIGKPYDYSAILGLGLRRDWSKDDAWFCSELVAWAFQKAGEPLFRAECLRRVTPQHLYMLAAQDVPWPSATSGQH